MMRNQTPKSIGDGLHPLYRLRKAIWGGRRVDNLNAASGAIVVDFSHDLNESIPILLIRIDFIDKPLGLYDDHALLCREARHVLVQGESIRSVPFGKPKIFDRLMNYLEHAHRPIRRNYLFLCFEKLSEAAGVLSSKFSEGSRDY